MATPFIHGFRQQKQTKKTAGSNKALRAAVRQQRRNQVRQNITADTKEDSEENDEGKDGEEVKTNPQPEIRASNEAKEAGGTKKKPKGQYFWTSYRIMHNMKLYLKYSNLI